MSFGMIFAFLIVTAIFAVPIGGIILFQYLRASDHRKKQEVAWGTLAQQRGGRWSPARGAFGHHSMWLPGPGQGVTVAVANGVMVDAAVARECVNPGGWHTHVTAPCVAPSSNYVVHGNEGERAARVLSPDAMRWFPSLGPNATIACGGRIVTVVMPGTVLQPERIQAAIEITANLASRGPAQAAR